MDMLLLVNNNGVNYIRVQDSCDLPACEGCDSVLDYTVYDADMNELDGGVYDYYSGDGDTEFLLNELMEFVYDKFVLYEVVENYELKARAALWQ